MDDMDNNQILTLLIDLKSLVAGIAAKLETTCEQQAKTNEIVLAHEQRIAKLEADGGSTAMWPSLMQLALKAVIVVGMACAGLAGVGAYLKGLVQ